MTGFASKHPEIVKFGVTFAAISATLLIVGGAIAAAVGAVILLGTTLGIPLAVAGAIAGIGIAIAAVVAFAVTFHSQIEFILRTIASTAKDVGSDIWAALTWPFRELANFISGTIAAVKGAMHGVATAIGRFIKGGSPIPEGPLHDLNLSRDLAYTLRPSPLVSKMRTVAAAVAFAAPMALAPAMAGAAMGPAASGGGSSYSPTYHITVNAPSGDAKGISDAVIQAIKSHDNEVNRILNKNTERRRRLEY